MKKIALAAIACLVAFPALAMDEGNHIRDGREHLNQASRPEKQKRGVNTLGLDEADRMPPQDVRSSHYPKQ